MDPLPGSHAHTLVHRIVNSFVWFADDLRHGSGVLFHDRHCRVGRTSIDNDVLDICIFLARHALYSPPDRVRAVVANSDDGYLWQRNRFQKMANCRLQRPVSYGSSGFSFDFWVRIETKYCRSIPQADHAYFFGVRFIENCIQKMIRVLFTKPFAFASCLYSIRN